MEAAFFLGLITGLVISVLAVVLFGFVMKNAVLLVNCDKELSERVRRSVALYEAEQYNARMFVVKD